MQITQEMLQQRLASLQGERATAVSAVSAYDGAIAQVTWEMAQLATVEPVAEANAEPASPIEQAVEEATAEEAQANG